MPPVTPPGPRLLLPVTACSVELEVLREEKLL